MKQSLIDAKNRAKQLSLEHPNEEYHVMDKTRCKPIVHSKTFLSNSYLHYCVISNGYYPYCKYINGMELSS